MKSKPDSEEGSVLVTAIILAVIVAIAAASALRLAFHEWRLSVHSSAWAQALHTAEAGVEMAMEEFYQDLFTTGTGPWSEWTDVGAGRYVLAQTLTYAGYSTNVSRFSVTADTVNLTATSAGRVDASRFDNPVLRTVQVELELDDSSPFEMGMVARGVVTLRGNALLDSFDSRDPAKSTGGQYDPSKRQSNITAGSLLTTPGAIDASGSGTLYGNLATAPGGGISIGGSFSMTGTQRNDLDMDIPDVVVPFSTSPFTGPAISGGQTITVNGNIDRSVPSISLGGNNTLAIRGTGRLRLYSGGETRFSGNSRVTMTADPAGSPLSVELYCNGDIFLNSVINQPGNPVNFSVYGTPNCRAMDFVGNDAFIGTLYAPSADARLRGNGGFSGAIVAGSIWHNGTADFHYDEALAGVRAPFPVGYRVRVWREL